MRKLICPALLLVAVFILAGCGNKQQAKSEQTPITSAEDPVKKGEYLVTISGCNDCHSPKQESDRGPQVIKESMLSGYPAGRPLMKVDQAALKTGWILAVPDLTSFTGPWGMSFAANLTPHQTGIGNWTEENFRRALKEGKYKGIENSRNLLPPMPWTNFVNAKDDDLNAIFAYLKSINPVENVVPAPVAPDQLSNNTGKVKTVN